MTDDDDGQALVPIEAHDDVDDGRFRARIDAGRGLIEQEEWGLDGESAGNQYTLLLTAGQGPEGLLGSVGEAHAR